MISAQDLLAVTLTAAQYWMGRDRLYPAELTTEIRVNAAYLLSGVNALLAMAGGEGIKPALDAKTGTLIASGWRPAEINRELERTSNAGKASAHIVGLAVDLRDHPDRSFARWCLRNLHHLEHLGLYMEDPRWTPTWVHLQRRAPGSGHRVYIPSSAPALALALPEQAHV